MRGGSESYGGLIEQGVPRYVVRDADSKMNTSTETWKPYFQTQPAWRHFRL